MNVRTLRSMVNKMKQGEALYVNTINCSIGMIEQLRAYIEAGILKPDEEDLKDFVKEEYLEKFRSGYSLLPQANYIRQ